MAHERQVDTKKLLAGGRDPAVQATAQWALAFDASAIICK
jgi:hypothetical protein